MISAATTCNSCGTVLDLSRCGGRCAACLFAEAFEIPAEEGALGAIGGHELIEEIARGGMGIVYRARQREPEREVALKTMRGAELDSPAALARFRHEARAMADLDHAAILPVFTFGEHDSIPFFTMKLATGGTLAQRLGDYAGRWREIAGLVATVADAVQYAHTRAVLHRDLKPGNILFNENGHAFVSDFGIAKLLDSTDGALTRTAAVLGTPHYLAPEIAAHDARAATTASDVWSLGVILYELLAQRRPFEGGSIQELLRAITDTEPAPLREVPRDLAVIAMKALAREPARRYATASELANDLRRWIDGRPIHARPVSSLEKLRLWARRNPLIASLCALLAASVITAAILLVAAYRRTNEALRMALLKEAQFQTASGREGQRFGALETLQRAAAIRLDLDVINGCAAALARADLRSTRSWPAPTQTFNQPEFSPDLERYAAPEAEGGFSLRATGDDRTLRRFPGGTPAAAFAFARDGQTLAAKLSSFVVQIWAADGSVPLTEIPGSRVAGMETGMSASFSPALGAWAVIAADGAIVKVSAQGETTVLVPATGKIAGGILFDPEGTRFALAYRDGVELWDARAPRKLWTVPQASTTAAMAWQATGALLAVATQADHREVLVVWATDGEVAMRLQGATQIATRLAFHPTQFILAVSSADSMLRLWDYRDASLLVTAHGTTRTLRWSPDGRHLAHGLGWETLGIMQFEADAVLREFGALYQFQLGTGQNDMTASPDGRLLVTTNPSGIDFWSTATRRHVGEIRNVKVSRTAAFVSADAKWVGYAQPEAHIGIARRALTLSPIGDRLGIGAEERVADADTVLHGINRDNAWLVQHTDSGRWELWPAGDASHPTVLLDQNRARKVLSPDFHWVLPLAVGTPVVQGRDLTTHQPFEIAGAGSGTAAFSPDSRWVLLRGTDENRLYETGTWRRRASWPSGGSTYGQHCFAFSPDSKRLAISYANETMKIFAVPEMRELITLIPPRALDFRSAVFSPDGSKLWLMGIAARVFEWDLGALEAELAQRGIGWSR